VEIGRGALEPEAAAEFLVSESETPARLTAPPSGLFLERVRYGEGLPPASAPLRAITRIDRSGIG
jgi:tRNA pseudouridine38-40 synthase